MTANAFTIVLLRLLGVYLLATSVVQARDLVFLIVGPQHMERDANLHHTYFVVASLAPACWYLLVGLLLVFLARPTARLIVPGDPSAIVATDISANQLASLVFAAAGVIIAALATPKAFHSVMELIYLKDVVELPRDLARQSIRTAWISLGGAGLQIACGIGLFLGARGISKLWHRVRLSKPETDSSAEG